MAGTIVIPLGDMLRYPDFFMDYSALDAPEGTEVSIYRSASVVSNLNESLAHLPREHEWVWFITDDHVFPRDILKRLLAHEADVVVPLCTRRTPPYSLLVMREESELYDERMEKSYPAYLPYSLDEVPDESFTCPAAGTGGMLVRRPVLDAIGYPWFESSDGVYLNEDFEFCRKIKAAGFEILCDPHIYLGHIGQVHVWPQHVEGRLGVKIDCGGPPGQNEIVIGDKPRVAV